MSKTTFVTVTLLCGVATAAPTRVVYVGELRQAGEVYSGEVNVKGALFASSDADVTSDATVWPQSGTPADFGTVTVTDGVFEIVIGGDPSEPMDGDLLGGYPDGLYLALWVDDQPLSPLQAITSAPYAVAADTADRLGGIPAEEFQLAAELAALATSGSFADLSDVPTFVGADQASIRRAGCCAATTRWWSTTGRRSR